MAKPDASQRESDDDLQGLHSNRYQIFITLRVNNRWFLVHHEAVSVTDHCGQVENYLLVIVPRLFSYSS
jgi:hypothetical protein